MNFDEAHERLISSIQKLYILGYSYKDVIKIDELYKCREYIFKKYGRPLSYPYIKTMINYVYSRDLVINPFGPWICHNFFDPLQIFNYAKYLIKQNDWDLKANKLAGVIFAILSLEGFFKIKHPKEKIKLLESAEKNQKYSAKIPGRTQRSRLLKKSSNIDDPITLEDENYKLLEDKRYLKDLINKYHDNCDIGYFDNPKRLYQISEISQQHINKYTAKLGIIIHYERYYIKGYKTRLWIANYNWLKHDFEKFNKHNKIEFNVFKSIKERHFKSGIDFFCMDRSFTRLCNNYERRFICDNSSFINKMGIEANPFIRIYSNRKYVNISYQINLFSYSLLLKSLYGGLPKEVTSNISSILKADFTKQIVDFKDRLIEENLYNNLHPISTTDKPNEIGKHFEQIERSREIISRISKHGIRINLSEARTLFAEIENKLNAIPPEQNDIQEPTQTISTDDFLNDEIDDVVEELYGSVGSYRTLIKIRDALIKIIDSVESIDNKSGEHLLKGLFTPHGSKTHRLSCRDLNLQGIPKLLSKRILTTKSGYTLLSADISGQDITVAANLAHRLFRKGFSMSSYKRLEKLDDSDKAFLTDDVLKENWQKINSTIDALKSKPKSTPIDFITDTIMKRNNLDVTDNDLRNLLRTSVKNAVYLTLYGGGPNTINKKHKKTLTQNVDILVQGSFIPVLTDYIKIFGTNCKIAMNYQKIISSTDHWLIMSNIQYMLDRLIGKLPSELLNEYMINHQIFSELIEKTEIRFSNYVQIRNQVVDIVKNEYPGIINSFDYYRIYYKIRGLTFPTLLDWQTVLDNKSYNIGDIIKKSTNYVIQASGAEFFRQWLIELSKIPGYTRSWNIINAIHDQVVIEVMNNHVDLLQTELVKSAKNAASIVGIDPETLNIPQPEDLLAKYHSQSGV